MDGWKAEPFMRWTAGKLYLECWSTSVMCWNPPSCGKRREHLAHFGLFSVGGCSKPTTVGMHFAVCVTWRIKYCSNTSNLRSHLFHHHSNILNVKTSLKEGSSEQEAMHQKALHSVAQHEKDQPRSRVGWRFYSWRFLTVLRLLTVWKKKNVNTVWKKKTYIRFEKKNRIYGSKTKTVYTVPEEKPYKKTVYTVSIDGL